MNRGAGLVFVALCFVGSILHAQEIPPGELELGPGLEDPVGPAEDRPTNLDFGIEGTSTAFRLESRVVLDAVKYGYANERDSGLELDTVDLRAIYDYGDRFRISVDADLLGADTPRHLWEAWAQWSITPQWRLTVGQMRSALGTEFATEPEDAPLVGYGFTSYLDGRYDIGAKVDASVFEESLWFEAGGYSGHGFGLEGHRRSEPRFSGRVVVHPWTGESDWARGFYAGVGVAWSDDYDSPLVMATPKESTVFRTEDLDGGPSRFLHIEGGFYRGPVRFGYERVVGEVEDVAFESGGEDDVDQLTSWTLYGTWNITGDDVLWERGAWKVSDDLRDLGPWGRLELTARYSNADLDRILFERGATSYDPSTQEVRTMTLGLGWSPLNRIRVTTAWIHTIADHELTTFGGRNRDQTFLLRFEFNL